MILFHKTHFLFNKLGLKLVRAHTSHIITIDGVKKMGIEAIFFLNNDIIILKCKAH